MAWTRRRTFGVLFTISVAVNLFAVGILIGVIVIAGNRFGPRGADGLGSGLTASPAFMALEPTSRQMALEMFRTHEGDLREQTRALRRAQRAVVRAMAAEPFDADTARAALEELRLRTDSIQAVLHNYLVDLSRDLSEEERDRLSRTIFRAPPYRMPLADRRPVPHIPAG